MNHQRKILYDYRNATDGGCVMTAAKDVRILVEGFGTVRLERSIAGRRIIIELRKVAYKPLIRTNLVSLAKAQASGISIQYPPSSTKMIAKHGGNVVMNGCRKNHNICELVGMRTSNGRSNGYSFFNAVTNDVMKLMYKRTCHNGMQT